MTLSTVVFVSADSYREFVDKVKKDVSRRGNGGLAFHKAIAYTATFRDIEGNKTIYKWKKEELDGQP